MKGKKISNQKKYEGIYRSRWNDEIIVGSDVNLIAFDPQTNSPVKNGTLLRLREKDKFAMETKSNFDSQGEFATFIFEKKTKRVKTLLWGATPMIRLKG